VKVNLLFESQKEQGQVTALVFPELAAEISKDRIERAEGLGVTRESDTAAEEQSASLTAQRDIAQAREEGRLEGLVEGEQRRREDSEIERSAVAHLCTGFAKERKRYFAEIETEVVKLALAIAARVLQRESAMDATLLKGVVKVALTKLGDVKGAVLWLHPKDEDAWRDVMKHSGLEVMSDASLEMGELRLEAAGGVAELGIAAQLVEIERGFFDLLARRPA
jgi:flagellar assembly protein FliH